MLREDIPHVAAEADAELVGPTGPSEEETALAQILLDLRAQSSPEDESEQEPGELPTGYVMDPVNAYLITDMLRAVVREGTGFRARVLPQPIAAKTGTTNDMHDAWFLGFSPHIVTGVWVGYDTAAPLGKNEAGSRAAGPIFVNYMREVLRDYPRERFPIPEGIVFARIDRASGLRARGHENVVIQPFREGTEPTEFVAEVNGRRGARRPRLD